MKRLSIAVGAIAVALAATPLLGEMPALAGWWNPGTAVAQNVQKQPQMQLRLAGEKQLVARDAQGKEKVSWKALSDQATVHPGDVVRYTISGQNSSDRPIKKLVVTQPIPKQMVYVLKSTTIAQNEGAKVIYSIDNGKTFVENPTVQVKLANGKVETKPAPADVYTHIRWNFGQAVNPGTAVKGSYQVKVR